MGSMSGPSGRWCVLAFVPGLLLGTLLFVPLLAFAELPPPEKSAEFVMVDIHNAEKFADKLPRFLLEQVWTGSMPLHVEPHHAVVEGLSEASQQGVSFDNSVFGDEERVRALFSGGSQPFSSGSGDGLLWNALSHWWGYDYFAAQFKLREWVRGNIATAKEIRGSIERINPFLKAHENASGQLFRERVQLDDPAGDSSLRFLTIRFWNGHPDALWAASGTTAKVLKLESANRFDSFTGGSLSLNDLFGWSVDVGSLGVVGTTSEQILAPVLRQQELVSTSVSDECVEYKLGKFSRQRTLPHLNGFSGRIYSDLNFTLRHLIRIDMFVREPHSDIGREQLWIDAQSGLPVYRASFDRRGRLKKWVIVLFRELVDGNRHFVAPVVEFIFDSSRTTSSFIKYEAGEFCKMDKVGPQQRYSVKYYDPSSLSG